MEETITLPRSGIVLTGDGPTRELPHFYMGTAPCDVDIGIGHDDESHYTIWAAQYAPFRGTREECIAWLDERVIALRSALLPRDARERVALALAKYEGFRGAALDDDTNGVAAEYRKLARAVLAALGVER